MNTSQKPEQAETLRDWLAQANPSLQMKLILTAGVTLGLLILLVWLTFGGGLASFADIPLEPGQPVSAADEFGMAIASADKASHSGADFQTWVRI